MSQMITVWIYSIISILIISLASLIGIILLAVEDKKLKQFLIYFISFSAGALLGDAFIHLLPEIVEKAGFGVLISIYVLTGIGVSFVIEKIIHWRHCHMPITKNHIHSFAIMNLVGDLVHNLIDGLIVGAAYLVSIPIGITTSVAVLFHEIPQEIADFGVLIHGGFTKAKALWYNFLVSLSAVLGVIISLVLSVYVKGLTIFLIPFTVGTFIYIASADLIPEMHKEVKLTKGILQLISFVVGIGFMLLLILIE